ncbi:MAG: magnesium transporter [Candidatus Latescibacteria bacterium]|nr:magnesium transporter [Candidatus Latescibacterota bacterium]
MAQNNQQRLQENIRELIGGLDDARGLIEKETQRDVSNLLANLSAPDIAGLIDHLDPEEARFVFNLLDDSVASQVITKVNEHIQDELIEGTDQTRLTRLVGEMESDDAADLIARLPEDVAREVLCSIDPGLSERIRELLRYEEDTAGGLMAVELVTVDPNATVKEAIEVVRKVANKDEQIYYVYVVDRRQNLVGTLSLRDLILAQPDQRVSEIMNRDVMSVVQGTDQEEVANIFRKYDLVVLPVVDAKGRLVGKITIDDIVDVIEEEDSEDIAKMVGTSREEMTEHSPVKVAGIRLPWLVICLFGGMGSATIVSHFEDVLGTVLTLAFFVPVLMDMGGNVGVQSATLVVRSLALGEIDSSDLWKRLHREIRTSLIMGLACGAAVGLFAFLWKDNPILGVVVAVAMCGAILAASMTGVLMPMVFKKLGIDPAVATGPVVTTINDWSGLLIYLGLATALLHWLR